MGKVVRNTSIIGGGGSHMPLDLEGLSVNGEQFPESMHAVSPVSAASPSRAESYVHEVVRKYCKTMPEYDFLAGTVGASDKLLKQWRAQIFDTVKMRAPHEQRAEIARYKGLMTNYRGLPEMEDMFSQLHAMLDALPLKSTIIDIGAGKGFLLDDIQKAYPARFHTVGVDRMREYSPGQGNLLIEWDLKNGLPPLSPDLFEKGGLIVSGFTLQYLENAFQLVEECWEVLPLGGMAVLHMGFRPFFSEELLYELYSMRYKRPRSIRVDFENPWGIIQDDTITISFHKHNGDKPVFPKVESVCFNKPYTSSRGEEVVWSNLMRDYKLVGEEKYKRETLHLV